MEASSTIDRVKSWPKAINDYIGELKLEMRRVTWPNRKQVESTTAVVIIAVFAFAAYFQLCDEVLANIINKITKVFAR